MGKEREAFRQGGESLWREQQRRALQKNYAREQRWWDGLEPAVRGERRARWAREFDKHSFDERTIVKASLAHRRARAGITERDRHRQWATEQPRERRSERSVRRQRWFSNLPKPLQQVAVRSWQSHRHEFDVPSGWYDQPVFDERALLPHGRAERDNQYLDREQAPRLDGSLFETAS